MADVTYRPGSWLAVVEPGGVVLVEQASGDLLLALRTLLAAGDASDIGDFIEALTAGVSFTAAPPFAVVLRRGEQSRIAVRGAITVAGGGETVTGEGVSTWREQSVDAAGVAITVPSSADDGEAGLSLPLASGVVLASTVSWGDAANLGAVPPPVAGEFASPPPPSAPELPAPEPDLATPPLPVEPDVAPASPAASDLAPPPPPPPLSPIEAPPAPAPAPAPVPSPDLDASMTRLPTDFPEEESEEPHEPSISTPPTTATPSTPPAAPEQTAPEEDPEYAHLWGQTVFQPIEAAAVRLDEEGVVDHQAPPPPPGFGGPAASGPVSSGPASSGPAIISIPPAFAAGAAPAVGADQAPPPPPPPARLGDHDNLTIASADLAAARRARDGGAAAVNVSSAVGIGVLSLRCVNGHLSPPHASRCRLCGVDLAGPALAAPRPSLGRIRLSTGEVIELERTLVLGRKPAAVRVSGPEIPRLVTLPGHEISRSHVEIRLEDWHVLALDLASRNGTILARPGTNPVQLVPQEPVPLSSGDVLDLGEGLTLVFEDLP